jgi:ribosomal protein S18 acetylase RimI-like enzyme
MIAAVRLKTTNTFFLFFEKLLNMAFPDNERRATTQQRLFADNHPLFFPLVLLEDQKPFGILSYWNFTSFIYIEHFAILPECRRQGLGKRAIQALNFSQPIVIEVELPIDKTSKDRIRFYENLGFTLWESEYLQPAYSPQGSPIKMQLMVKGNLTENFFFNKIRSTLYRHVYSSTIQE